jgi:outer membrane protein assembly factor BamB
MTSLQGFKLIVWIAASIVFLLACGYAQQPRILWERVLFERKLITDPDNPKKELFLYPSIADINNDSIPEILVGISTGRKGTFGKKIAVLKGKDGMQTREYAVGSNMFNALLVAEDGRRDAKCLVVGAIDHNVYFFDRTSGAAIKKIDHGDEVHRILSADINSDGFADYIIVGDGTKIAGYDGSTRMKLWEFKSGKKFSIYPLLKDIDKDGHMEVVFPYNDNEILVINAENGRQKWARNLGQVRYMGLMSFDNSVLCAPVLTNYNGKDVIVAGGGFGELMLLDVKTGEEVARKKFGNLTITNISLGDLTGDGVLDIIFVSIDHKVYGVNGKNLEELWELATGKKIYSSPAIADMDNDGGLDVVINSNDDHVYCIDGKDGTLIWKYKLSSNYDSGNNLLADLNGNGLIDVVVDGSRNGKLLVLETDARCKPYEIIWAKWGGNNQNTATYGEK